jgi:hypothetical protein
MLEHTLGAAPSRVFLMERHGRTCWRREQIQAHHTAVTVPRYAGGIVMDGRRGTINQTGHMGGSWTASGQDVGTHHGPPMTDTVTHKTGFLTLHEPSEKVVQLPEVDDGPTRLSQLSHQ